jgi:hypothetical protein
VVGLPTWLVATVGLLVIAAMPIWPWSRGWTWAPAAILGMGLVTMIVFALTVVPA